MHYQSTLYSATIVTYMNIHAKRERDLLFHSCLNISHPINIFVLSEKQEGKGHFSFDLMCIH